MYSTIFLCQFPSLTECYIAHKDCPPISGKPSQTMAPHVSKCIQVGPDVWNHALEDINSKKSQHNNPPGTIGHSASMPLPAIMTGLGCVPVTYLNLGTSTPTMPFESPCPSPLLLPAPLLNFKQPPKCTRVSSFTYPEDSQSLTGRVWSPSLQHEFREDLCKLLIVTHSLWNTAHNPQM